MKKDKKWAQREVDRYLSYEGVDEARNALVFAKGVINQLDEPETLSLDWIDDNKKDSGVHSIGYYVPIGRLHDLLVPEQELPVIPKFVAEFLIGKEDYMLYELLDDEWLYKEHDRVAKWLYDNDELTNKQREIDLVMARDRGYEIEKELKYYIQDQHGVYLLAKTPNVQGKVQTVAEIVEYYGVEEIELDYELSEKEIKGYDPRYWVFRKPVEELEE